MLWEISEVRYFAIIIAILHTSVRKEMSSFLALKSKKWTHVKEPINQPASLSYFSRCTHESLSVCVCILLPLCVRWRWNSCLAYPCHCSFSLGSRSNLNPTENKPAVLGSKHKFTVYIVHSSCVTHNNFGLNVGEELFNVLIEWHFVLIILMRFFTNLEILSNCY